MGKGNVGTNLSDANFKNISNRFSQKNFERKFLILDDSHISGSLKHTGTSNLICICYSGVFRSQSNIYNNAFLQNLLTVKNR